MKTPDQIRKDIIVLVDEYIQAHKEEIFSDEINQNSVIMALLEGASAIAVDCRITEEGLLKLVSYYYSIYTKYVEAVAGGPENVYDKAWLDKNKGIVN